MLEDETLFRRVFRNMIEQEAWLKQKVILYEADDVDEAIKLIKQECITLAIVDIDLKRAKNGFDFLKEVQEMVPPVHSLMHSNRIFQEDKDKALELGAKGFVSKPLGLSDLVRFISAYAGPALLLGKPELPDFSATPENGADNAEGSEDEEEKAIRAKLSSLFHDINKPALNMFTLLSAIKNQSGPNGPFEIDEPMRQEFDKIPNLIQKQRLSLESLEPPTYGPFADTAKTIQERYLKQYAFITEFLDMDLAILEKNQRVADEAISIYKKMKKENNQFATKIRDKYVMRGAS
jgi:DNA-binding NarL/FixJ family response regulator